MLTETHQTETGGQGRRLARAAFGSRRDWIPQMPRFRGIWPSASWVGPIAIVASTLAGWFAFAAAQGEHGESVAFGLFIGAASIVLMAWSFLLAVRVRLLEPLFGGLDRMYKAHRWAGTAAVIAMFLHTSVEPEIEGGIRGASKSLADSAEELAGVAEYLLYGLIAISLLRVFPYRLWRITHKLLGIPFVFASAHFLTAEKPYENTSAWGIYFGTFMAMGAVGWLWRVLGRDVLAKGNRYRVGSQTVSGDTTTLTLQPDGRPITFRPGQFASLKIESEGMAEPHIFSIASAPNCENLVFHIRALGDWSDRLLTTDVTGSTVWVEGPYGRFHPLPSDPRAPVVWVAGGVGITPFLSAIESLEETDQPPLLVYAVREASDATALDYVVSAAERGVLRLEIVESSAHGRLTPASFTELVGESLQGAHVAVCGPTGLVETVHQVAHASGAASVETEGFDIRLGIGPDVSRELDDFVDALGRSRRPYNR